MFRKAERKQAKLRLAISGPAGSGKTYSALLIAQGLAPNGKIALIDSERGSGELYADLTAYDIATLEPPYSPKRYIQHIKAAEKAGYDVLIIDSLSHAWTGAGGVLEMHDRATAGSKSGNSFMAWKAVTPEHNALVDAMIGANLHVIVTMRTKTAYDMLEDGKGGKKPLKIGLAPVQRDGMEYEFTTVFDLSVESHVATVTKDRTQLFDGEHFVPTPETGAKLLDWLMTGKDPIEASQHILEELKTSANTVESVSDLTTWWRSHGADISQLTAADRETLTSYCAERKLAILESADVAMPDASRHNGADHDAIAATH